MLTKVFAVFVGLSLLCMAAKTQDFCDSFLKNDHKLIAYSNRYSDDLIILLIIGSDYWEIKAQKNGPHLEFKSDDKLPLNSSALLKDEYSYAIQTTNSLANNDNSEPAFYDSKTESFDVFRYKNQVFDRIATNVRINGSFDFSAFNFGFHTKMDAPKGIFLTMNGMVAQSFDEKSQTYNREFVYKYFKTDLKREFGLEMSYANFDRHQDLMSISRSYQIMAVCLINWDMFVLFRFDSTIKYCLIDECSTNLRLLIDCKQRPETKTMFYVIIGILTVIVIIIVVIITLCVRAYRKAQKAKREIKSGTDSDTIVFAGEGSITQDMKKLSGKNLEIAQFISDMNIDPQKKLKNKKKKKGQTLKCVKPKAVPTRTTTKPEFTKPKK